MWARVVGKGCGQGCAQGGGRRLGREWRRGPVRTERERVCAHLAAARRELRSEPLPQLGGGACSQPSPSGLTAPSLRASASAAVALGSGCRADQRSDAAPPPLARPHPGPRRDVRPGRRVAPRGGPRGAHLEADPRGSVSRVGTPQRRGSSSSRGRGARRVCAAQERTSSKVCIHALQRRGAHPSACLLKRWVGRRGGGAWPRGI